ncbi:hypothetical protein [Desulfococcus sp.]|uniref:hypothetical protein n=1 Tax=Desulfococcus sp. TaxID=2025834 RepID=UPI0035941AD0
MEWRAGKGPRKKSVIVPDEWAVAVLHGLEGTAIAVDPYRDHALGRENTRKAAAAFRRAVTRRVAEAEARVKQELGLREVPAWAANMVKARIAQDPLTAIFTGLVDLCGHALTHDVDVEILGQ